MQFVFSLLQKLRVHHNKYRILILCDHSLGEVASEKSNPFNRGQWKEGDLPPVSTLCLLNGDANIEHQNQMEDAIHPV